MTEPRKTSGSTGGRGRHPNEESRETAALYALGALPPEEARAFEAHLAEGCPSCALDADDFREALLDVVRSTAAESQPAGLRAKLLSRIAAGPAAQPPAEATQVWKRWKEAGPADKLHIVRAGEGAFEPTAAQGVSVKPLSVDPERRYVTMLVRMEPGTSYPRHLHAGAEECYVLQGDIKVGDAVLRAGDYQRAEGGSEHGVQSTEGGCLLLIVSSQEDALL